MSSNVVHEFLKCEARKPGDTTAMAGREDMVNCQTCINQRSDFFHVDTWGGWDIPSAEKLLAVFDEHEEYSWEVDNYGCRIRKDTINQLPAMEKVREFLIRELKPLPPPNDISGVRYSDGRTQLPPGYEAILEKCDELQKKCHEIKDSIRNIRVLGNN